LWDESYFNKRRIHAEYQEQSERYRREASQNVAEACIGVADSAPDFRACILQKIEAYDAGKSTNEDLRAQQDMALWSFWMMLATSAAVIVTGVGIYFVRETLAANTAAVEQAREANRITRESAIADKRAWIRAHVTTSARVIDDVLLIDFFAHGENIGASPAKTVRVAFDQFNNLSNRVHAEGTLHRLASQLAHTGIETGVLFPAQITAGIGDTIRIPVSEANSYYPFVGVGISYLINGAPERVYTFEGFEIWAKPDGQKWKRLGDMPIETGMELHIRRSGFGTAT